VYVVGLGRSFSVSSYLVYALRHLNKRAFLIDGLGGMFKEQLSTIEDDDVLIVISFSPYAKDTTTIGDSLVGSRTKQIIITDSQISPLASSSDICFVVKEAKVDAFRSQAASLCLAQTLAVSLAFHNTPSI
jgi:DNA-binding MurR/RpiR family transcriptional regulator